ncbi:DNA-binding protein WhiA [Streptococcus azizii]|uniref:Probable cell division protein WhiA n=1 Tax=Streptococcus azizii TaxID=1579424 RepID=A0AB36JPB0_9STRE|nr:MULTISPECIES: DNA-binding protein WhiA [Streptococcus]MBF0775799.1 DNA-binding protein WhiA [Streptococcus sp. 19428wD3_AN2]ONK29205.1 DNA-binding protein WhiA [Streptococcus azizii]ONK29751.1 DNA-binding protein WhiA [Streptococcus azizii]ONK30689.1 DNA-binding protein WhiA [Streptococcus azizii]TFU84090.1 DNA-binding protein WhiA [Streptococcus sp. AN2]
MSFSVQVKEEIISRGQAEKSELAAMIKLSGSLGLASAGLTLSISSENAKIARHLYEMLYRFYRVKAEIRHHQKTNLRKNRVYTVFLKKGVSEILDDLYLADSFFGMEPGTAPAILNNDSWSQSYLRGAFLASGSVKDPETGKYQLEIASIYEDHAHDLAHLLQKFLLDGKVIERSKGSITYLQRAEDIMDFLLIVGAEEAKTEFENVKLLRETRNDLNRTINAEAANIARTVTASMKTIHNISKIMETIGLDQLPSDLQEVAQLRIQHPDYSIQQLADSLSKPITKSGLNHRLRKINKIADEL